MFRRRGFYNKSVFLIFRSQFLNFSVKKEEDDSGVGFTMDVRESEPIDLSKLFGNGAQEKETPPAKIFPKQPKITLAQALTKMQAVSSF